jgi:hypothetical protein
VKFSAKFVLVHEEGGCALAAVGTNPASARTKAAAISLIFIVSLVFILRVLKHLL